MCIAGYSIKFGFKNGLIIQYQASQTVIFAVIVLCPRINVVIAQAGLGLRWKPMGEGYINEVMGTGV